MGGEGAREVRDDLLVGAGRGERHADAGRLLDDAGGELDQAQPEGVELGGAPEGAPARRGAQGVASGMKAA